MVWSLAIRRSVLRAGWRKAGALERWGAADGAGMFQEDREYFLSLDGEKPLALASPLPAALSVREVVSAAASVPTDLRSLHQCRSFVRLKLPELMGEEASAAAQEKREVKQHNFCVFPHNPVHWCLT